jgi:hypothetical protein
MAMRGRAWANRIGIVARSRSGAATGQDENQGDKGEQFGHCFSRIAEQPARLCVAHQELIGIVMAAAFAACKWRSEGAGEGQL